MKVKICGIKTLDEALAALEAGADLIGFNFYPPSPRYISPSKCSHLQSELDSRRIFINTVGVFVNPFVEELIAIMSDCNLDLAQLSGDEPHELLEALPGRAYKGIRPRDKSSALYLAGRYTRASVRPSLLVDAYQPEAFGGSGRVGDWQVSSALSTRYPILLAGGLNTRNVKLALSHTRPWGVDVASGVESKRGMKDARQMAAFVRQVRQWEQENVNVDHN